MATLRNLAIGLIRQAGYTRIAATIRKIRNNPHLLFTILTCVEPRKTRHDQQKRLCATPWSGGGRLVAGDREPRRGDSTRSPASW